MRVHYKVSLTLNIIDSYNSMKSPTLNISQEELKLCQASRTFKPIKKINSQTSVLVQYD